MTEVADDRTLARLEWPRILERWRRGCRTPQAFARLGGLPARSDASEDDGEVEGAGDGEADDAERSAPRALFERTLAGARDRLAETSEARALLDAGEDPPLGGVRELSASLRRASMGGVVGGHELREVGAGLAVFHAVRRFLAERREAAPRLADLAGVLEPLPDLLGELDRCIDAGGEVRDDASPELSAARREASQLAGQLQDRLARYLQDAEVQPQLSDRYYTVRNDRYVLPVRAEAKRAVRGIVHDASGSGSTLFIEPEAVVELNNRLRQAELGVVRETHRVLQRLGAAVAAARPAIEANLETLVLLDLAFARGRLSQALAGVEPRVEREGVIHLDQLRHPLLDPDEAVPNDLRLGEGYHVLVISGPNAGGKTVAMKAMGLAALFVRAGLHVPAAPGARVDWVERVLADIGDEQDLRQSLSTFSAHMANLSAIVRAAGPDSLVVLDEIGVGTDPGEGAALAQAILEALAERGARVVATTHYNLLKEMADVEDGFCNASVEFDPDTLAPTYRLHIGAPGSSSATAVAARMGMPNAVLERANRLLEREDRQLDRMLSELAHSRAALDEEQRRVEQLRAESETVRDEYRTKLERLQERRDELFARMRDDLDHRFRDAHAQVAAVIRDLQRGGTAQEAARARERLQGLEERARDAEREAGLDRPEGERFDAVDWRRARPGDAVAIRGGASGVLVSLPDRRGRVTVQAGAAKLVVPADRVGRTDAAPPSADPGRKERRRERARERAVRVEADRDDADLLEVGEGARGGTLECDLRGHRVDEALDAVDEVLDRAAAEGRDAVRIIHGHGTGALRRAVREHLRGRVRSRPGERDEGGEGVTVALIGEPRAA